jgi:hypothetical protein
MENENGYSLNLGWTGSMNLSEEISNTTGETTCESCVETSLLSDDELGSNRLNSTTDSEEYVEEIELSTFELGVEVVVVVDVSTSSREEFVFFEK